MALVGDLKDSRRRALVPPSWKAQIEFLGSLGQAFQMSGSAQLERSVLGKYLSGSESRALSLQSAHLGSFLL